MSRNKQNIATMERVLAQKTIELMQLQKKVDNLRKANKLPITDHAIVRYLERVKSVDINQVYSEILTPGLIQYYHALGDGTFPIGIKNIRAVIKDGVIITILS